MILRYEFKKIFNKKINKVLFCIVLLITLVFSVFAIYSFEFVDKEGNTHTGVFAARELVKDKNQWVGELTPKVINKVVTKKKILLKHHRENEISNLIYGKEVQSYMDIIDFANAIMFGEHGEKATNSITDEKASRIMSIYKIYLKNLERTIKEYGKTDAQRKFLTRQYGRIKIPFYYEAYDSWDTMLLYATTLALILVVVIAFITAGIFAEEFRYKADSIYFSSQYGRGKAIRKKIVAAITAATLVYWSAIGLLSLVYFGVVGTSGASASYQLVQPYSLYPVSHSQMYGIIVISGYVASLLSASVAMLIAVKTRLTTIAVVVPFVLFCVSPFVGRALPFKRFFTLTPDQLNNIINCAKIPYIYQIAGVVFRQIPFILLTYSAIAVLLVPMAYRCYKNTVVND